MFRSKWTSVNSLNSNNVICYGSKNAWRVSSGDPPLQTVMEDSTLARVSSQVSRLSQGLEEDPNLFTLLEEAESEKEQFF